jgi:hypothetical protein
MQSKSALELLIVSCVLFQFSTLLLSIFYYFIKFFYKMASNNDLFGMLQAEDKLDGTNYLMCSYMMKHILIAKQLWNIVVDVYKRPASYTAQLIVIDPTNFLGTVAMPSPTQEQLRWDEKDAQAHALIALSVK